MPSHHCREGILGALPVKDEKITFISGMLNAGLAYVYENRIPVADDICWYNGAL